MTTVRSSLSLLSMCVLIVLAACDRQEPANTADTVRRGNVDHPATFDPAKATDVHTFNILFDLYEGLVTTDAAGNVIPGVAAGWEIDATGRVYTFTLRDDARWSDGSLVTADQFVAAWRRVADPETAAEYGFLLESVANFQAIQSGEKPPSTLGAHAPDDRTLVISLVSPTPHFLGILTMPVTFPQHSTNGKSSAGTNPATLVVNGAYQLADYAPGKPVVLTRNPYFHSADDVPTQRVEYHAILDAMTEFNTYLSGDLDITATIPVARIGEAQRQFADETFIAPLLGLYYLAFDLSEPPLDKAALREALSLAIDRQMLVDTLGRGGLPAFAIVPEGTANHVAATYDWAKWSSSDRIARAIARYREAGYSQTKPLRISLLYDVGSVHEKVALIVSDMWQQTLGVEVTLEKKEWQYFLATREQRDQWQIMRFSWFGDYNDPTTFLDLFASGNAVNLPGYANSDYDALLDTASTLQDTNRRAQVLQQAEAMLLADYPIVPLYFMTSRHMVSESIDGFTPNTLDRHLSRYIRRLPTTPVARLQAN